MTGFSGAAMPLATVSSPGVHGAQQQFVNAPVHAEWWQALHADKLNRLIDVARTNSPILIAAQATLRQARQNYAASSDSTELPQVSAKLGGPAHQHQQCCSRFT